MATVIEDLKAVIAKVQAKDDLIAATVTALTYHVRDLGVGVSASGYPYPEVVAATTALNTEISNLAAAISFTAPVLQGPPVIHPVAKELTRPQVLNMPQVLTGDFTSPQIPPKLVPGQAVTVQDQARNNINTNPDPNTLKKAYVLNTPEQVAEFENGAPLSGTLEPGPVPPVITPITNPVPPVTPTSFSTTPTPPTEKAPVISKVFVPVVEPAKPADEPSK